MERSVQVKLWCSRLWVKPKPLKQETFSSFQTFLFLQHAVSRSFPNDCCLGYACQCLLCSLWMMSHGSRMFWLHILYSRRKWRCGSHLCWGQLLFSIKKHLIADSANKNKTLLLWNLESGATCRFLLLMKSYTWRCESARWLTRWINKKEKTNRSWPGVDPSRF